MANAQAVDEFGLRGNRGLRKVTFAGAVRRAHRRGKVSDAEYEKFLQVMASPSATNEFFEMVADYRDEQIRDGAEAFPDGIIKLFDWLIANWESIAKIIEFVISLFASGEAEA